MRYDFGFRYKFCRPSLLYERLMLHLLTPDLMVDAVRAPEARKPTVAGVDGRGSAVTGAASMQTRSSHGDGVSERRRSDIARRRSGRDVISGNASDHQ